MKVVKNPDGSLQRAALNQHQLSKYADLNIEGGKSLDNDDISTFHDAIVFINLTEHFLLFS